MLTWNKAAIAGLGPAFTTVLLTLDTRMGWGLGPEFWGAVLTIVFGLLAFVVPNAAKAEGIQPMAKCTVALALLLTLAMLAGCAKDRISPAESLLLSCDGFASELKILAPLRADGKLPDTAVKIVDTQKAAVDPICLGQAPDVNADVKQLAVDSGVKVLTALAAQFLAR